MFTNRNKKTLIQWLSYLILAMLLTIIFLAYLAPEMMVTLTNQVWAMCGW